LIGQLSNQPGSVLHTVFNTSPDEWEHPAALRNDTTCLRLYINGQYDILVSGYEKQKKNTSGLARLLIDRRARADILPNERTQTNKPQLDETTYWFFYMFNRE
jgi:hypothetical protein